ncbi:MAG: cryptochrome/photolyase family protein [Ilumatobacteraceae bacterium]
MSPTSDNRPTVWVLGDQLHRRQAALAHAHPESHRILMVESQALIRSRRWHLQRAHLVVASMRRFADELRTEGFEVDYRHAASLRQGLAEHRKEFAPEEVDVTEPNSWSGLHMVRASGCRVFEGTQFLCHYRAFADWRTEFLQHRKTLKMEDFYRWQRRRLDYLMDDGGEPETGVWNYDAENRQPPPKDAATRWSTPIRDELDELDHQVIAELAPYCAGQPPDGTWATTRSGALARLEHFITYVLPEFGPHEDAMTTKSWHLAHSLLSPYLNIGLLHPREVCDAVQQAYVQGRVSIASAEGFIRQVIGWREYVWGLYWLGMPEYAEMNELAAHRDLPPVFTGHASTEMNCVASVLADVDSRAYAHHIQRLMVIGNLCLISGVEPQQVTDWMWANFIDGAEWVMVPNVIGMSQFADGGRMATKPYASGGAYIDKMSDYCKGCRFDRTKRVGDDACPFTTLYWDFMARHEQRFVRNARVAQQVRAAFKLSDLDAVRVRATEVLEQLSAGKL